MSMSMSMSDTPNPHEGGLHTPVSAPVQNPFRANSASAANPRQLQQPELPLPAAAAAPWANGQFQYTSGLQLPVPPPPAFGTAAAGADSSVNNPFSRNRAGRQSLNSNATSLHSRASRAEQVCV
jgi:hypothetical protein